MDIWQVIAQDFSNWLSGILASFQGPPPAPPTYVAPFPYATNAGQDWGGQTATYQTDVQLLSMRLGMTINNAADAAFFNQYARPNDVAVAQDSASASLALVTKGKRYVSIHNNTSLAQGITDCQTYGFTGVFANPEQTGVCATLEGYLNGAGGYVSQMAGTGLQLGWVPLGTAMRDCIAANPDWVTSTPIAVYQTESQQPFPTTTNPVQSFLSDITPTLTTIRLSATAEIWIQISVTPQKNPSPSLTDVTSLVDAAMLLPASQRPDIISILDEGGANPPLAYAVWRRYRSNG